MCFCSNETLHAFSHMWKDSPAFSTGFLSFENRKLCIAGFTRHLLNDFVCVSVVVVLLIDLKIKTDCDTVSRISTFLTCFCCVCCQNLQKKINSNESIRRASSNLLPSNFNYCFVVSMSSSSSFLRQTIWISLGSEYLNASQSIDQSINSVERINCIVPCNTI